ncbi:MAG TPA: polymer-forming cytoskeletal protein [Thermoanaerobaculales bacterium]|nr:polymer-forming cytoskeletal protein [Thermoanaerobaculales bacterium]HPA81005.1 polymer-forming cytoskeletal protein [Thermoanaerobaculales bacterium]HQL31225.1 polymer-forming cytoskeletal protein [Thermoanaerobaculales bacterium]HQN97491.1 polymer-forming cytoskeletal protein [Thermoanaerobaculales bacterium]HQP44597.1 polymer-forming cytoskeletal protein [Thermoanaerobaculales bacterium]
MWKKGDSEETGVPDSGPPRPAPGPSGADRSPRGTREAAVIGPSITIRGDVTGDEDLTIQGRIEGTVMLKQHNVSIGPEGKVDASIHGRAVTVEGEVKGDLHGEEQVVLKRTARVQGNIQAPRVTVEDGARFRGGIDMGEPAMAPGGERPAAARREPAKPVEAAVRPGASSAVGTTRT